MTLHRRDLPIATPCGADWSEMSAVEARARLCAQCNKVVHDLSSMREGEVRAVMSGGPVCVRYLYDVHGRVLLGGVQPNMQVVPASALRAFEKAARRRWLATAALAASSFVFEACGAAPEITLDSSSYDAGVSPSSSGAVNPGRVPAMPVVEDAAAEASDVDAESDAGDTDSGADPDAGP